MEKEDRTIVIGDVIFNNPSESLMAKLLPLLEPTTVMGFLRQKVHGNVENISRLHDLIKAENDAENHIGANITASLLHEHQLRSGNKYSINPHTDHEGD